MHTGQLSIFQQTSARVVM